MINFLLCTPLLTHSCTALRQIFIILMDLYILLSFFLIFIIIEPPIFYSSLFLLSCIAIFILISIFIFLVLISLSTSLSLSLSFFIFQDSFLFLLLPTHPFIFSLNLAFVFIPQFIQAHIFIFLAILFKFTFISLTPFFIQSKISCCCSHLSYFQIKNIFNLLSFLHLGPRSFFFTNRSVIICSILCSCWANQKIQHNFT